MRSVLTGDEAARTRRRESGALALRYAVLAAIGLIMLYPLVWLASNATALDAEAAAGLPATSHLTLR